MREEKNRSPLWRARRGGKTPCLYKPAPKVKETIHKHHGVSTGTSGTGWCSLAVLPGDLHLSYFPHSSRCLTLLGGHVCGGREVSHQRCRTLTLASGSSRISVEKLKDFVVGPERACGAEAKSNCSNFNRFTLHLH